MADNHTDTPATKPGKVSRRQMKYLSREAILEEVGPSRFAVLSALLIIALIAAAVVWSDRVEITSVAKTTGKVIPSGRERVVQHLEGGSSAKSPSAMATWSRRTPCCCASMEPCAPRSSTRYAPATRRCASRNCGFAPSLTAERIRVRSVA